MAGHGFVPGTRIVFVQTTKSGVFNEMPGYDFSCLSVSTGLNASFRNLVSKTCIGRRLAIDNWSMMFFFFEHLLLEIGTFCFFVIKHDSSQFWNSKITTSIGLVCTTKVSISSRSCGGAAVFLKLQWSLFLERESFLPEGTKNLNNVELSRAERSYTSITFDLILSFHEECSLIGKP